MRTILSIDGGGIRGLIPAVILGILEERLAARGLSRRLADHFDMVCGTSTGGIIAAALTVPHSDAKDRPALDAAGLAKLYREDGPTIFSCSRWRRALAYFNSARYDAAPLEAILQQRLGRSTLADALTGVVLTAYDITARQAVFMTNTPGDSEVYYAWQAARATSAAPTYFDPCKAEVIGQGRHRYLVDGGVFMNDPTLSAYVEALKWGYAPDDLHVFAIGTGYQTRPYAEPQVRNWGLVDWVKPSNALPLLSIMMHGQASSASYQAGCLLNRPDAAPRYARIDMELVQCMDELDDATPGNLACLEGLARASAAAPEGAAALDRVVEWLVRRHEQRAVPRAG